MIDIHCHILPFLDDGAASWDIAGQMCRMALADGITHLVATPHASPRFPYDRAICAARLGELQQRTESKLQLGLGCDFHLSFENLEMLFAAPERFLIENTPYLLLELNAFALPPRFEELLFRMQQELKLLPILTHPERHSIVQDHPERVARWIQAGCVVQITANALTGQWGTRAKDTALWLLRRRMVHLVATDAHNTGHRPPVLSRARDYLSKIIGTEAALALVEVNPRAVFNGTPVSPLDTVRA